MIADARKALALVSRRTRYRWFALLPLAVCSAVIEAGRNRIVYVESAAGVYDMRAVQLGPAAGDYYPVVGGLREDEKVVTVGAFLVDSENRLNPTSQSTINNQQ